jgi:hypothetical protein
MAVWIRVLHQGKGRDINLPKTVAHRSVKGNTLKLMSGRSREITDEEWAFIKAKHADLLPGIEVLSNKPDKHDAPAPAAPSEAPRKSQ